MKKIRSLLLTLCVCLILTSTMTGCLPTNSIPKNYKEGVNVDRQYPDHLLDIYDNAIVYDCSSHFDDVLLSMGTEDEMRDIIIYYREFLEINSTTPLSYEENSNEFYTHFIFEGYEFEIEAHKPEGQYEEELYENTIFISTKKIDKQLGNDAVNLTPEPTEKKEAEATPTPALEPQPTQKTQPQQDETPLASIENGSWFSVSSNLGDGSTEYVDYTIYIKDESLGTLHILDYYGGYKCDYEFAYELVNGVLTLELENDVDLIYDAYQCYNTIHLVSQIDGGKITLLNWESITGIYPSDSFMSAYGDWIYYDTSYDTSNILAFYGDDGSMIYNLFGDGANDEAAWEFNNGIIEFTDPADYAGYSLDVEHRGNVLITTNNSGMRMVYNRVSSNVMGGAYELVSTNEPDLDMWVIVLDPDGTSSHSITADGSSFDQEMISWFVNYIDGTFNLMLNGDQHIYHSHFSETGLVLYEPIEGFSYVFVELD